MLWPPLRVRFLYGTHYFNTLEGGFARLWTHSIHSAIRGPVRLQLGPGDPSFAPSAMW